MEEVAQGHVVSCKGVETKDWYSWINLMPPTPNAFFVVGEVFVPNPGVVPMLTPRVPQGINPDILLLDLSLYQKPGVWPSVIVCKPVRYEKIGNVKYTQVQVFCEDTVIANIKVNQVH